MDSQKLVGSGPMQPRVVAFPMGAWEEIYSTIVISKKLFFSELSGMARNSYSILELIMTTITFYNYFFITVYITF